MKKCIVSNTSGIGIHNSGAELTLQDCHILQCGEDGVLNASGRLVVSNTIVEQCADDGIFSNPSITVKDCTIRNVGRHGIKSRGGSDRRGKNDIQGSPWD